ncbi:hypothetical protein [Tenacibaculum ovolyticum]|uniref:hypothetical protein n=1 Tax=Tenacibaculum ovolyticum TaxID=104270 RepID=UPI0007ECA559|nr:hypothetical protein [Tenacibaculum ovolyticum]
MITAVQLPKNDTVFLTTNPIIFEVSTDLDASHYITAKVTLDTGEVISQIWGRYTPTNLKVNLQNLFLDFFKVDFEKVTTNGLTRQSDLLKKVTIELQEVVIGTEEVVSTFVLPDFYVLSSNEKQSFDSSINLQKLSILPEVVSVTKKGVIRVPLWLNAPELDIKIISGITEIYSIKKTNLKKGIFYFDFDFSTVSNLDDIAIITFTDGHKTIEQIIQFAVLRAYDVEQFYVLNNINIYEYVELFGKKTATNSYKRKIINDYNDVVHQVDLSKTHTVKIYSHFLLENQLPLLSLFNESKKVFYLKDGVFLPFVAITKKASAGDSRKNYYQEYIELKQSEFPLANDTYNYQ